MGQLECFLILSIIDSMDIDLTRCSPGILRNISGRRILESPWAWQSTTTHHTQACRASDNSAYNDNSV